MAMHLSATTWTVYGFANFFGMSREHVRWMNFPAKKNKSIKETVDMFDAILQVFYSSK